MSAKGAPAIVVNGYIFTCKNTNQGFKSHHYTYEDRSCPVQLNTELWDLVQTIKGKHTCIMPNTTIVRLLKCYLVQVMPTSKDLSATQLAVLTCKYLSPTILKRVPTHNQLVNFVSDRRQSSSPLAKSATTIEDLILSDAFVESLNVQVFRLLPSHLTYSHCLFWCLSNIPFDIPKMALNQYHMTVQVSTNSNPSST
ncbi:hypothetical protein DSO57_1031987 [Entomophthora muscae]|uniref:Uncharacterized protein n=1 Tax=Entomophthora muscae TaxID=34485 RepID=A0ACC2RF92_9FUNG|nr:hypothetical protein DSO57_1031987 [Entomophthora muscae]